MFMRCNPGCHVTSIKVQNRFKRSEKHSDMSPSYIVTYCRESVGMLYVHNVKKLDFAG